MTKIPLLVTPNIPDIAPPLRARRPTQVAAGTVPPPSTRRSWRPPVLEAIQECVVDVTPPSLPEIGRLKAAVVRNRVCDGLGYLLPTDRSRVSVTSDYRVDLAAMFRRPYACVDPSAFDDEVVRSSAAVHLRPGGGGSTGPQARRLVAASATVVPSRAAAAAAAALSAKPINAASASVYNRYRSLVPKRDCVAVTESPLGESARSAVRGSAAPVPLGPAEVALKEQVESILASCGVRVAAGGGGAGSGDDDAAAAASGRSADAHRAGRRRKRVRTVAASDDDELRSASGEPSSSAPAVAWSEPKEQVPAEASGGDSADSANPHEFRALVYARKSSPYATHQDLLEAPVPRPEPPPSVARSTHLSPGKVKDIWDWLTSDFHMTPFEHFINVCG